MPLPLTLSDVKGDRLARGRDGGRPPGGTAVVVGDGAVGLCGVLAASSSAPSA